MNLNKLRYLACTDKKKYNISDDLKKRKSDNQQKNDMDLAIALSLSETQPTNLTIALSLSETQPTNLIKDIDFDDENQTSLDDIDGLLKASIISLGGNRVLPNEGGGDCLFHTFSTHLDIDHMQLREDATEYISINWNRFKDFALKSDTLKSYESREEYINHMSQEGVWGDHLSLLALCELYQTNATIIVVNGVDLSEPIKINVGSSKTVLIKFNSEFHYEAIL